MSINQQPQSPLQRPLSIGDWIIIFILTSIPFVGFILILYWSFADDVNINKKNFSKAILLIMVIMFVAAAAFALFFGQYFSEININNPRLI